MKRIRRWIDAKFPQVGSHGPSFESASVHHILTANLRGETDLARFARSLLDADLAVSAAWPSETAVRVPYRYRKQARSIQNLRSSIAMLKSAEESNSWLKELALVGRHPKLGILHLRAKWISTRAAPRLEEFLETESATTFAKLFALHPIFTVRHVLPNVRLTRGNQAPAGREAPSVDSGLAESRPAMDAASDNTDALTSLAEAERAYLERQVVSAAIRQSDAHLFGGPDRDNDGFVRLMLRESYHDFLLPGSEDRHHVVFEPRLLLHDSGVAQIDLSVSAETELDVRQLLAMMWGPEPLFIRSEMPLPLIVGTEWESSADFHEEMVDAGQPLGVIEHTDPVSMHDLLHLHLFAVSRVIKRPYSFWTSYPVAIVETAPCCGPEDWPRNHREDLIRLTIRSSYNSEVSKHVPPPVDLALSREHSLYARLGSAIYLQWLGRRPEGISELDTVLILEYAQLVYMRLCALEEDVSRIISGEQKLRALYREAVRLFSELRQRELRSGEARDIVRYLFDELGVMQIRQTIETALSLSAAAYSTRSSERASRRAWWITLTATLIGLVVALPPLQILLSSVPSAELGDAWPAAALQWLAAREFWGPWIAVGCILATVAVLWVLGWLWRWRLRRLPSFRRGYKWPAEFSVTSHESSPAAASQQHTRLVAELLDERTDKRTGV